jgi:hypothetical protein
MWSGKSPSRREGSWRNAMNSLNVKCGVGSNAPCSSSHIVCRSASIKTPGHSVMCQPYNGLPECPESFTKSAFLWQSRRIAPGKGRIGTKIRGSGEIPEQNAETCGALIKGETIYLPNVQGHRRLAVARLLPGEERAQAGGVTRVGVRCTASFEFVYLSL